MTLNIGNRSSEGWGELVLSQLEGETRRAWHVYRILCKLSGGSIWLNPCLSLGPSLPCKKNSVPPHFSAFALVESLLCAGSSR